MNIKHRSFFHRFTTEWTPQKQKPCARRRDADRIEKSASGDPAMVLMFRMASILIVSHGHLARHVQRPDCCWTLTFEHESCTFMLWRMMSSGAAYGLSKTHAKTRAFARVYFKTSSTTNVVLFDERLVTRLVRLSEIVEERTAGRHALQQT